MTIQTGVGTLFTFKKQSALGTVATNTGGQRLRRREGTIDLVKDSYESEEKVSHFGVTDSRHGFERVQGRLSCELSPGTYSEFFAGLLRRDFTATAAMTGLSITIAASGSLYTVTRGAGSYLTDGLKVGDVIRLTAGSFSAPNLNKNLVVVDLTATVATVMVLNGSSLTPEGPIASATVTVPGKRTFRPMTAHTNDYFSIEKNYSEIDESEVFVDVRPSAFSFGGPAQGMDTIDWDFLGRSVNRLSAGSAPYFTSPTAETTTGVVVGATGAVIVNGTPIAIVAQASLNVTGGVTVEPVRGSKKSPDVFRGRIRVSGQMTAFLENVTLRDIFVDETEASLVLVQASGNAAGSEFISFAMPRVKLDSATADDPETGKKATIAFRALHNGSGGAGIKHEQTELVIHDSAAA
jgi:hypothetical protein